MITDFFFFHNTGPGPFRVLKVQSKLVRFGGGGGGGSVCFVKTVNIKNNIKR